MTPFPEQEELRALLDSLCEERITPDEVARIEELVLTRPEAEAYYVQYLGMFAELSNRLSTSTVLNERSLKRRLLEAAPAAAAPRKRNVSRVWGQVLLAAACLGLLVSAGVWLLTPQRAEIWQPGHVVKIAPEGSTPGGGRRLIDENGEPLDDTVAVIRAESGAVWDRPERRLSVGATLAPGHLHLTDGIAQIEFYSGATVVLEAPVDLEIVSSMEAFCWQGKLRATVPPHAQGFTIGSPRLDLIDRGTEFGMNVSGLDSTEVHVFDGKVELYHAGKAGRSKPQQELISGEALRVDDRDSFSPVPNSSSSFVTAQELLARTQIEFRRRQRNWEAASAARRTDPSVVLYYTFEPEDDWSRMLPNQALAKAPGSDGTVVGCSWSEGRWPGKKALRFQQVSDRVRLQLPGEYEAVTMAMWTCIDDLPNRFHSLLMSDSWDDFEGHWHIDANGTIELGVQGEGRKNWVHYFATNQFHRDLLGQWVHLAMVYDLHGGQVTQYLNGNRISELPIELKKSLRFGACELGNWNPTTRKHHHPVRFLTGRIDEFTFYSRALSASEIVELASEN